MTSNLKPLDLIKNVDKERANITEKWWLRVKVAQLAVLAISIVVVSNNEYSQIGGVFVVLLTVFVSLAEWRFDYHWHISQAIHRKFEFWDGLDWTLSTGELANLQVNMPSSLRKRFADSGLDVDKENYFASDQQTSPRRLTENLVESSWWTKHISKQLWLLSLFVTFVVLFLSIGILLIALQIGSDQSTGILASKIVVSVIVFMFTAGFFRTSFDYLRLHREAELIEHKADTLLAQSEIRFEKAIALYTDYQFLRETSPPVLSIAWKSMRSRLNESWDQHRRNDYKTTVSSQ